VAHFDSSEQLASLESEIIPLSALSHSSGGRPPASDAGMQQRSFYRPKIPAFQTNLTCFLIRFAQTKTNVIRFAVGEVASIT